MDTHEQTKDKGASEARQWTPDVVVVVKVMERGHDVWQSRLGAATGKLGVQEGSLAGVKRATKGRVSRSLLLFVLLQPQSRTLSPLPLSRSAFAPRKPLVSLTKTPGLAPAFCAYARLDGCSLHSIASHSPLTTLHSRLPIVLRPIHLVSSPPVAYLATDSVALAVAAA